MTSKTPLSEVEIRELRGRIAGMSHAEKVSLGARLKPIAEKRAKKMNIVAPQTDDELWEWVRRETGFEIPRIAVCEDHSAPFDFIADGYFERESALFQVGSREMGKTLGVSILHYANSELKPGTESITFGAIEAQAKRAYEHVKSFVFTVDEDGIKTLKPQMDGEPLRSQTTWKTGSKIELIVGTASGVNSPHPQKVHADEVDLMEDNVWQESQPSDLIVPTPLGPRRFGDLKLGEEVFGRDGQPTKIVKITELGARHVYRVDFTDRRSTECCADHLWVVAGGSQKARGVWKILRTSQLLEQGLQVKRAYRFAVPAGRAVSYPETTQPVPPYTVGVVLGDGYIGRSIISFRSVDRDIVRRVDTELDGYRVKSRSYHGYEIHNIVRTTAIRGFATHFKALGLADARSATKFLPSVYKMASREQRIALLQGLFDTDGCVVNGSSVIEYATISEQLARDVREVVYSLGGRAILRSKRYCSVDYGSEGTIYTLDVSFFDAPLLSLPRKLDRLVQRSRPLDPSIRNIELIGVKKTRCIGVDNEDGTYRTTDYLVTHNSRNMSSGKTVRGVRINAQDFGTSTRKSVHGIVQGILDEVADAEEKGYEPPWKIYISCVYEAAEEVPCCRRTLPAARDQRLRELGRDPDELCDCNRVVKGEWAENQPRTLDSVCRGRFFRSRGWMTHVDVKRKFRMNTQNVWEAQMECRKPMADGLYLESWSRERFTVQDWLPHPHLGQVWLAVDWGGSAESAVLWVQGPLRVPVKFGGMLVPMKSYVVFDELLEANIGAGKLGDHVVARELGWRRQIPGFRVTARFADMAGKQQRDDWREHDPPLRTVWYLPNRDFDPTVTTLQDLVADNRYWVDSTRCSRHCDDIESWRQKNGREVHDDSSHTMAASRYLHSNVEALERRRQHKQVSTSASPVVVQRAQQMAPVAVGSGGDQFAGERAWRESLGDHFPNRGR